MSAGLVGYVIGGVVFSLLLPAITLIIAKFVPAMKRNPKVVYSVCAVEVVLVCLLGAPVGDTWVPSSIAAVLALLVLLWAYRRDATKGPA